MNAELLKPPSVLKKEHLPAPPKGALVTITRLDANVPAPWNETESASFLYFEEIPWALSLRAISVIDSLIAFLGKDTDAWIGRKVVLYVDPTIMHKGKRVGGIRVRAPKPRPEAQGIPAASLAPAPPPQGWQSAVPASLPAQRQDPPWMEDPDPDSYAADDFYTPEDEP